MPVFSRSFLGLALILTIGSGVCEADIGLIQTGDEQPALWLRRVIRLSKPANASTTTLHVRGSCHASIYVNGQRLTRHVEVSDGRVLAFDVTSLIRDGNNGFAVSAHRSTEEQPATVAVWVSHNGEPEAVVTDGSWKQKLEVPPVGWEKTDFNPHGWQDVQPSRTLTLQEVSSSAPEQRTWQRETPPAGYDAPLSLTNGDHVVLLGGTFFERAQLYGHLEAMLLAAGGASDVTFRNLGWSGDTVFAESRGIFDTPEQGFERLIEHIRAEEPTVILVCYGQNEAMQDAGADAVNGFGQQLHRLHHDLQTTGARIVLVSPHPLLFAPPPIPSPNRFNPAIEDYAVELQRVARDLDLGFVDLFSGFPDALGRVQAAVQPDVPFSGNLIAESAAWTDNGMHWNEAGYRRMAIVFAERCLQRDIGVPLIRIDAEQTRIDVHGGEVRDAVWGDDGSVEFEFRAAQLTSIPWEVRMSTTDRAEDLRRVTVSSSSGALSRLIDTGEEPDALQFVGASHPQYEQLRSLIVRKNELYFHRWRPQNITYLYGFRKHEQGNNAAEIAMFDPLIEELEEQLQALQAPRWETLKVTR